MASESVGANAGPEKSHYKSLLGTGNPKPRENALEAAQCSPQDLDLSSSGIDQRLSIARSQLQQIVKDHLDGREDLLKVVDKIIETGRPALESLAGEQRSLSAEATAALEVIVRTDGSRPSFMVRKRTADLATSPVGSWFPTMQTSKDLLDRAMECVGRVDVPGAPQGFEGTAFLVQENFVITNRHVLQEVADRDENGKWIVKEGAVVDFGHEYRTQESYPRRSLKSVVFHGSQKIDLDGPVDHRKLDVAVLELAPASASNRPRFVLPVDADPEWATAGKTVFIVGYPGSPALGANPATLLETLFQTTYGCKRVAPGYITKSLQQVQPWTIAHDATTLGGNSGSVVLVAGREHIAAALHYGGRSGEPRENWGHVLSLTLDQTDGKSPKTLKEVLKERGVELADRVLG